MELEHVEYERRPPAATIWLARPEVRNAVDRRMAEELREAVVAASSDPEIRVIVLRGRGDDFCAGSDLAALDLERLGSVETSFDPTRESGFPATFSGVLGVPNAAIPKVTVAAIHGHAVGGGFELALATDLAVASDDAVLGDCHILRGVVGGGGLLAGIARVVGVRRMNELVLTGRTLSGQEACDWGLVNRSVPRAQLDAAVAELVDELARLSPQVQRLAKLAYGRALEGDRETLDVMEQLLLLGVLRSEDASEGIRAFLDKRTPRWRDAGGPAKEDP